MTPERYYDHAATSWPKSDAVLQAMVGFYVEGGVSPARGEGDGVSRAQQILHDLRSQLARIYRLPQPDRVILGHSATLQLNLAIQSWLQRGRTRWLTTRWEHNAIRRPLLAKAEVLLQPPASAPPLPLDWLEKQLATSPEQTAVAVSHACNVTGEIFDVAGAAKLCDEAGVPLLVDACQAAGWINLSLEQGPYVAVVVSGHKHLGGPQGTSAMLLGEAIKVDPSILGGTGGESALEGMPEALPERLEPGTPNMPGFAGWLAALNQPEAGEDLPTLLRFSQASAQWDWDRFASAGVFRPRSANALPIVLAEPRLADPLRQLEVQFRLGLHCNPWAHAELDSLEGGLVRLSLGHSSQSAAALEAILLEAIEQVR